MFIFRFLKDDDAPTMVEYGMMIGLIALVALIGVSIFGLGVDGLFQDAINAIP